MVFFLKLVGASFVALLLLVAVGIYFIKYKFRKMFGGLLEQLLTAAGTVPPFRIKLTPVADQEEFDEVRDDAFEQLTQEIRQIGFRHIGDFESDVGIAFRAFYFADRRTHAVIYEHYAAGVWADFVRRDTDGNSWTYSTHKEHGMDSMPGKVAKFLPEMQVADVAQLLWSESPADNLVHVPPEDFAKYFQQRYAEEMNWNIKRGGPTEKEIRRVCELTDRECTSEGIQSIQAAWQESISNFLSENAIKQFNKENNFSRADAGLREYRVFAVHDRMPDRTLMQSVFEEFYVHDAEDEDDDDEPDPEEQKWRATLEQVQQLRQSQSAIEIAEQLIKQSGEAERYEYIGEVSKPVKAHIWLRPSYEDDEEYDEELEEVDALELD